MAIASRSNDVSDEFPKELQILGLHKGMTYSDAKETLLNNHWDISTTEASDIVFQKDFPEVSCSSTSNTLCSTGFYKNDNSYNVTLKQDGQRLVVESIY